MGDNEKRTPHKPTVLVILDGWGVALPSRANAITQAHTPFFDSLVSAYPATTLQASGEATGLPWGEVGNSEVGHTNIGAGCIVYQELSRINSNIRGGQFANNSILKQICSDVKKKDGVLHLVGLASPGGVHSHIDHLIALLEFAKKKGIKKLNIHAILDGRDAPFASGIQYIEKIIEHLAQPMWRIASLMGRHFAMDRDNHWDRTEQAYQLIAHGVAINQATDPLEAIRDSYEKEIHDEHFVPCLVSDKQGTAHRVEEGDAVLFFNIRADRMRQLVSAFAMPAFDKFQRQPITNVLIATLTEYDANLPVLVAFPKQLIIQSLASVISGNGKTQLHIAETEKYAHITYFLNGGHESPYPGEKRIMIPSPPVASYDKKPMMSSREITEQILVAIEANEYDFIAVNYANADMVGHTGILEAAKKAIEALDESFSRIVPAVIRANGAVLITADHGNAEQMFDLQTGKIDKEHTNNPVPCIMIAKELEGKSLGAVDSIGKDLSIMKPEGLLSDVAPTILELMDIQKPAEMEGRSLLSFL